MRLETAQQSLSQIQEEKDRLVRERNEQVRILEEDNRKQQAKYEQQLEEIETRSKRTVEEKEKLREEKDIKKCIMKKNILATCVVILLMMSGCQLSMDKQTILPVLDLGATIG